MSRIAVFLVVLLALCAAGAGLFAHGARHPEGLALREIGQRAGEAYIFGFPLVLMDETRAATLDRQGASQNQLVHVRTLPGYGDEAVVRPNRDTLYSLAWLDLSAGPVELVWPQTSGRYWLFQVMDSWTDVAGAPGSRTQGAMPGRAFITGPDWTGSVPDGAVHVAVSTPSAWVIGRIAVAPDPPDLEAGRALQSGFSLVTPEIIPEIAPRIVRQRAASGAAFKGSERPVDIVSALPARDYFQRLAVLMARESPRREDAAALRRFLGIGLFPGAFDQTGKGWIARRAASRGVAVARQRLADAADGLAPGPNGWRVVRDGLGDYGTNYELRAGVAMIGLGANRAEDAIYPNTETDAEGRPLSGDHTYRIRFEAGESPPAAAFWSITAYDLQGFLLDTPRHALGDRDALVFGSDGSLEIVIGAQPPASAEAANVLPVTPGQPFALTARLYDPEPEALSGSWTMPPVERID
ncbi:MAG: DUF1254 domain-containing protein [Oceanicaulis sp.]